MEFFCQNLIFEVRILLEVEMDAVTATDIVEFFDFNLFEEMQSFLFFFLQNSRNLWMIYELRKEKPKIQQKYPKNPE